MVSYISLQMINSEGSFKGLF